MDSIVLFFRVEENMKTIVTPLKFQKHIFTVPVILSLLFMALAPSGLAASQPATGSGIPTLGIVQQWSVTAPEPSTLDEFGYAVALDGNTAIVGARNADPNLGGGPIEDAGAAYVYTHNGKTWVLQATLAAKDASPGDTFGVSVAISGNTIVVGATGVDLEDQDEEDGEVKDVGAAYIFTRSSGDWVQQVKLTASDRAEDDSFGSAVAIYKNTAVIAAETKIFNTGTVYVFYRSGVKDWKQQARLAAFPPSFNFGASVAVYGDLLAVGSTQFDPLEGSGTGEVFLYRRNGKTWEPEAELEAENGRPGDAFGNSVAIYSKTVVVGAHHADPDLGGGRVISAGAAYVFTDTGKATGEEWKEEAMLTAYDGLPFDQLGQSVDIYGNTVVVGAAGATQAGNSGAGAAYVFTKKNGAWGLATRAVTNPTSEDDNFGQSVAVYRDWFVVGASGRDPDTKVRAGEAFMNLLGSVQLPSTGFAPGQTTVLPVQPEDLAYQNYGEMWLDIPTIKEKMAIVGVPKGDTGWDVRWLSEEAGYLEGTSFPTWAGNTGLAGHAVLPDGTPGPFAELQSLRWGDQVIIHAWGQRYIYEVRENSMVYPNMLKVLRHEDLDWVTLITCQGYDAINGNYRYRRVVRAVLVAVQQE
jgi:LPXTG-site transpeptidase (sortase) family protein